MTRSIKTFAAGVAIAAFLPLSAAWAGEFTVRPTLLTEMKAVYGQVQSRTIVPARARISGTIADVRVAEGDEVRQGEVIAVVVDDKIALQLRAAEAKAAALVSQLENARTELERAQQLLSQGAGTQARVDAAQLQFDVITNQLAAATAEKAVVEQMAQEGETLAPATGRVLTVPITAGSVIMAGEAVARIASGRYYLRLSLPERHAAEIVEDAVVSIGARGRAGSGFVEARQGRIAKVYPEIENGRVIADVEVADVGDYFVNERTLVSIPVGQRRVLSVPPGAVRTVHGVDYVRLAGASDVEVAVVLGQQFEDGGQPRVEVLTGLRDGDAVVVP